MISSMKYKIYESELNIYGKIKKEDEEKVVGGVGYENTYIGNREKWKNDENRKKR